VIEIKTYNYEYNCLKFNNKYQMFRVPIQNNLDNTHYKSEQLELVRSLFPNGIKKQMDEELHDFDYI